MDYNTEQNFEWTWDLLTNNEIWGSVSFSDEDLVSLFCLDPAMQ